MATAATRTQSTAATDARIARGPAQRIRLGITLYASEAIGDASMNPLDALCHWLESQSRMTSVAWRPGDTCAERDSRCRWQSRLTSGVCASSHARRMDDFDSELIDLPRWNSWFRVSPVQFEGEDRPVPRGVRLCCPAARAGDPVHIIEGKQTTSAMLVRVECSILHVRRCPTSDSLTGP